MQPIYNSAKRRRMLRFDEDDANNDTESPQNQKPENETIPKMAFLSVYLWITKQAKAIFSPIRYSIFRRRPEP